MQMQQQYDDFKNNQYNENEYNKIDDNQDYLQNSDNKQTQTWNNNNTQNKNNLKYELDAVPETSIESEQTYQASLMENSNQQKKLQQQQPNQLQKQIKKIKFSPQIAKEQALNQQLQQQFPQYKVNELKRSYAHSDQEYDQNLKTSLVEKDYYEQNSGSLSPPHSYKEGGKNNNSNSRTYFQTQPTENELIMTINNEKEKNQKLEERVFQQEKLLNQMRVFHNQICKAFEDTQEELIQIKGERSQNEAHKEKEQLQLMDKLQEFEVIQQRLESKNSELQHQLQEKNIVIKELQEDLLKTSKNLEEMQKNIELYQEHFTQFERENRELKRLQNEQGGDRLNIFEANMKIANLEDENAKLQITVEGQQNNVRIVLAQRDQLVNQINQLNNQLNIAKQQFQKQQEQVLLETKKKYEEKINQIQTETQYKYHQKKKMYEDTIKKMQKEKFQNQQDSQRLQITSFLPQQMQYLSMKQQQQQQQQQSSLTDREVNHYDNDIQQQQLQYFIFQFQQELQAQNLPDLLNKIKEIKKFINCLIDMVENCHPKGFFQEKPSLKQSWRWLKKVMEEYMSLKKLNPGNGISTQNMYLSSVDVIQKQQQNQDLEINKKICEFLKIENKKDIIPKLADILIDQEVSFRLFAKLKKLYGQDKLQTLSEMERFVAQLDSNNNNANIRDNSRGTRIC